MKNLLILLSALLCLSCLKDPELLRPRTDTGTGRRTRPDDPAEVAAPPRDTLVYVLAAEFPESYDWERDTAYESASCQLVLYLGKERILSVPCGAANAVSPDPDMARIRDGHLYTDYSTETETLVKRDGKELFRYPGREALRGFLLLDGKVHTLGQNRSGKGFSYRIDGEAVLVRESGTVLGEEDHPGSDGGALWTDGGKICFTYLLEEDGALATVLVEDGKPLPVQRHPGVSLIHDQRRAGGVLYRVENRGADARNPFVVCGDGLWHTRFISHGGDARRCRICPDGNGIAVTGCYHENGEDIPYLWKEDFGVAVAPGHSGTVVYGDGKAAVISRDGIFGGTVNIPFPGPMRLMSPKCAKILGGRVFAAVTGTPCILYRNDIRTDYPVHGFLSALRVEVR